MSPGRTKQVCNLRWRSIISKREKSLKYFHIQITCYLPLLLSLADSSLTNANLSSPSVTASDSHLVVACAALRGNQSLEKLALDGWRFVLQVFLIYYHIHLQTKHRKKNQNATTKLSSHIVRWKECATSYPICGAGINALRSNQSLEKLALDGWRFVLQVLKHLFPQRRVQPLYLNT